jgi:hypothetical protein
LVVVEVAYISESAVRYPHHELADELGALART